MPDPNDPRRFGEFILEQAKTLRAQDRAPATRAEWMQRRTSLKTALLQAMGPMPETPCPLQPETFGVLRRSGYRIEKLAFQSRPDVWVTANLYVPDGARKNPAVLAVHGHWAGARRDPVVQSRCLGLVKLGFVVLCIDAFGSGERYTEPAPGTYHGALYGSTLWPTGHTLLGMQVYDNRRAVDYLLTRNEVDGTRIGITGASGGGNQSMHAGAVDERLACVVPVCSVGQFQAYLKAACCVCEVLPGALKTTEEGDVLGLVAPRALMVISATRDAFQFSPGEAARSIERANAAFQLMGVSERVKHVIFESGHDYSKPMREAMYGWMTRWLKNEGDGRPIAEPVIEVESAEALACFPGADERPEEWLFPTTFAGRVGRQLVAKAEALAPRHAEEWDSTATDLRRKLARILGEMPTPPRPAIRPGGPPADADLNVIPLRLNGEANLPIPLLSVSRRQPAGKLGSAVVLHLDGKAAAMRHPLSRTLAEAGWRLGIPDLRAIGEMKPIGDAIRGAPDHNSAEHAIWIGRPLLGQWAFDARCVLEWLAIQPNRDPERIAVVGLGQAGIVAIITAALFPDKVTSIAAIDAPATLVTARAYPENTRMGLLAPGLLTVGDVAHLAALAAPKRLLVVEGRDRDGDAMSERGLHTAYGFTRRVYEACRVADRLTLAGAMRWEAVAAAM